MSIPRCEHPRPDRKRESILNLNGTWDFEIDNAKVGVYKKFFERPTLDGKITVPFCVESRLSGVAHTDFMYAVWYKRKVTLPAEWCEKRIILHIDACDYAATVYVNGKEAGNHRGGFTSFSFDITKLLKEGENDITVFVEDDLRSMTQVGGKQSRRFASYGCYYTRTTGIWQTVWLEAVEKAYVISYKAYPNITDTSVALETVVNRDALGGKLTVTATYKGKEMGSASCDVVSLSNFLTISLAEKHLWELGAGRLYDLTFTLEKDGKIDTLQGYFGLREVALSKEKGLQLNGKTVFGRFVLDQGFYPDGILTAPSDEALIYDIETSMACGFNGARLHQKVFEPRFLYHADRLGYMVFGETGNWGLDHTKPENIYNFLPEWLEEVERDFSHPSVIGWCPFNETWDLEGRRQYDPLLDSIYDITKAIDKTRPTITVSGSFPTKRTDVHDVHDYERVPEQMRAHYAKIGEGVIEDQLFRKYKDRQRYNPALPVFVSEYGGILWTHSEDGNAWGYGKGPATEEEFFQRLEGLTDALLENPNIFAYCYTQLTDVEQEQNGVMTYERELKFPAERFYRIFAKKAAIEE